MMKRDYAFGLLILAIVLYGCASVNRRVCDKGELKLSQSETELVWFWSFDKYIESIMESKGYKKDKVNPVVSKVNWMFVAIAGIMFVAGFSLFGIAYITHQYKCNVLGFISLIGSGTAIGFARLAPHAWVIPVAGIVGGLIWWFTHSNKDFSLYNWVKNLF